VCVVCACVCVVCVCVSNWHTSPVITVQQTQVSRKKEKLSKLHIGSLFRTEAVMSSQTPSELSVKPQAY
jgi:hypothetical protein